VTRLRDDEWDWPVEAVDFRLAEQGGEAAGAVNPAEMEAAAEAAAAAAEERKPQGKKKGAVGGIAPAGQKEAAEAVVGGIVRRAASASEAIPAGEESANYGFGGGAAGGAAMTLTFDERSVGTELVFSTFASTPIKMPPRQIPGPGGLSYPDFAADEEWRRVWPTVEHYYQAMKFPNDPVWQEEIRNARTPAAAKRMGLDRAHPVRADWDAVKVPYMRAALEAKFKQNPVALAHLLQTQGRRLVYSTKADAFWGEGSRRDGQNKLGELLMGVRQKLRDMPVAELLLKEQGDKVSAGAAARPGFVEAVLEAQGLPRLDERAGDDAMYNQPANMVSAAQEVVSAATGGQLQLAGSGAEEGGEAVAVPPAPVGAAEGGAGTGFQQQGGGAAGGVYLFVNPVMAGQADMKARRARAGGAGRAFTWEGAAGGGGGQIGDSVSGGPVAELSSVESTAGAEVMVMKEGQ
jgi:ribA/ribD-fused uncharacterized protein